MYTTVIFDLDGTLTDPRLGFERCIAFALTKLGRDVPGPDEIHPFIGPAIHGTMASLLKTDDAVLIEEAVGYYRQRLATEGIWENIVYPGIPEVLQALMDAGCTLFVATAKPTTFAVPILEHCGLGSYFTGVYGSRLDRENTPKAELIRAIPEGHKIAASDAAMVGDRRHDIEGACEVGVYAVGVTYGYGSVDELTTAGADVLCGNASELLNVLSKR